MARNKHFNQIGHFLNENDALSRLLPNVENLRRVEKSCRDILPTVFLKCRVLSWENNKLALGVPTQAFAAKIRQNLPFLQTELQKKGFPVQNIQVKVKIKRQIVSPPTRTREPLSDKAKGEIEKLAKWLKEQDANSDLASAVQTLLDHA